MHQRHALALVLDGIVEGAADQPLGAFARDRLDPDTGSFGKADFVDAHLARQELDDFLGFGRFGGPFDTRIDVFGVLAEDHHVDLLRRLDRARHALEVTHRAQADVEIEQLAQRDVERTDTAADRRRQRSLDADQVFGERPRPSRPAASY